jgi:hypothetical protein
MNEFVTRHLQKIIDYLKMDVEGAEYSSLEAMFKTDILQKRVKQLGFEIHVGTTSPNCQQPSLFLDGIEAFGGDRI